MITFVSMARIRNRNRAAEAAYRDTIRDRAREAGLSTKAYTALVYPSVKWSYAVGVIRRRCKKSGVECTLIPSDISSLWNRQNGICPITGWEMTLRKSGTGLTKNTMTVDRIEQTNGYIPGNIRLVAFAANNARYIWSDSDLIEFCKAVIAKHDG